MPGQTQPQRPAGWYRSMEPAWATEHYDFPPDPTAGDTHTATDNSEWTFDLHRIGEWDLSRYSPGEAETGIRLFEDAARKAPAPDQTPREQLTADLMSHRWFDGPRSAHSEHRFDAQCAICGSNVEAIADAVIAAGWRPPARVIKTTDGLETLAVGVFVVDDRGAVWRRGDAAWIACPRRPDTPLRIALPAVVLHTPENGDH